MMNIVCNVLALLIIFGAIYLSYSTKILKDPEVDHPQYGKIEMYSFARTQGLWWTTLIGACFVIGFGAKGEVIDLNPTCLVLLSIGVGTTAIGGIIDTPKDDDNVTDGVIPQNIFKKRIPHFLRDILSDSTGITVYRYQALIFNLIFSVVFLVEFLENISKNEMEFPVFENETLGLMGISAATYLGMKANEK